MSLRRREPRPSKTIAQPEQKLEPPELGISLGAEQERALQDLRDFWQSKDRDFHLLQGYAGTGKSTLCTIFLRELPPQHVRLCATTNKAVSVLDAMCQEVELDMTTSTIHKLLRLVPEDRGGQWKLRQMSPPNLAGLRLIVVDECSMISEDLWSHLQDVPCQFPVKVLFMGDPAQLPPVKETESPSFSIPFRSQLLEVFRQGKDHPILAYSLALRQAMAHESLDIPLPETIQTVAGGIEIFHDEKAWQADMLKSFSSPESKSNEDQVRVLTWTNRRVGKWNGVISKHIYPVERGPFSDQQPLILTSPVTKGGWTTPWQVVLSTDEPVRMIGCRALDWRGLALWELDLRSLDGTVVSTIYVPPELKDQVEREIENWQVERVSKIAGHDMITKWKRRCVGVQPASAITIHRSQGSSFNEVYLDLPSILSCPERQQMLQLLYVAVTRARSSLKVLMPRFESSTDP